MSVRDIEARLASQVEDQVLQRLGYREASVSLPDATVVEPRPPVKEMSQQQARQAVGEQILTSLGSEYRPVTLFEVQVPRTYPPAQVRAEGVWTLALDGEEPTDCRALLITRKDARWVIILAPQRRTYESL